MHFFFNLLFVIAAIKWGDWKNWREYYPTYLFFIGGDFFKNAVLHDYRLWSYKETIFGSNILYGHLIIDIMIIVLVYSSTLLIYLGNFPRNRIKQLLWIMVWVFLYSLIEFINLNYLNLIEHHHGWNIAWSILFNIVMFTVLKIHVNRPLLAWMISILFFALLWILLEVPKETLT
ncbi:CBO0543 family protein [Metabacillus idriensis]|uniref:CBO0543 family protein n=1 Tax=Metabacillus idriensis TaxID=324768 RepID=UPI00296742E2|nr:CBO0543 family protein [Metabacillus idriensis]